MILVYNDMVEDEDSCVSKSLGLRRLDIYHGSVTDSGGGMMF